MFRINLCLAFLISVFLFSGCSAVQPTVSSDSMHENSSSNSTQSISAELERNRRLWREKNISDYDFELERFCEGMGGDWTRTFRIRENKTLSQNDTYAPYQYLDKNSVEKLFDYVQESLGKELEENINVTFDKEYGFPETIRIVSQRTTGYEFLKIKKFEIVK